MRRSDISPSFGERYHLMCYYFAHSEMDDPNGHNHGEHHDLQL